MFLEKIVENGPWSTGRINHSVTDKIKPNCSLETLIIKLKLKYCGNVLRKARVMGKDYDAWENRRHLKEAIR